MLEYGCKRAEGWEGDAEFGREGRSACVVRRRSTSRTQKKVKILTRSLKRCRERLRAEKGTRKRKGRGGRVAVRGKGEEGKSSTISSTHPFSQRRAASRPQIFFRFRVHFSYDQRTQTTIMRSTRSNTIPDVSFKRPCKRGAQADLSPFPFPLSLLRTPSSSESRRRYCST